MIRDRLASLARGTIALVLGVAIGYAITRYLGWTTAAFIAGFAIRHALEDVWVAALCLPARWRNW